MKNKSWHQNRPTGQNRNIILDCWHNKMPIRGLNYEKALNAILKSKNRIACQRYYDTYIL